MEINTTWGKNISTKFYLNKRLKSVDLGERKNLYPLYVTVIYKRQVVQFKYFGKSLEPAFYTQDEFDNYFGDIDLNDVKQFPLRAVGLNTVSQVRSTIVFLLTLFDTLEKDEFSLVGLPLIIRQYYDLEKTALKVIHRSLIKEMFKHGFESLVPIIDWDQHPVSIENGLIDLQEKFKLKKTRINFEQLPFQHIMSLLNVVKDVWKKGESTDNLRVKVISRLNSKSVKDFKELTDEIVTKAIEFYQSNRKTL